MDRAHQCLKVNIWVVIYKEKLGTKSGEQRERKGPNWQEGQGYRVRFWVVDSTLFFWPRWWLCKCPRYSHSLICTFMFYATSTWYSPILWKREKILGRFWTICQQFSLTRKTLDLEKPCITQSSFPSWYDGHFRLQNWISLCCGGHLCIAGHLTASDLHPQDASNTHSLQW